MADANTLHNGFVLSPDPFARLRLTGGRFEDSGMPVETLVELGAYRDLVVGVAKELFRARHPDRKRLPRGFEDRLHLSLRTVEEGSAVPVLERAVPAGTLLAPDDEFTQARDLIGEAVEAIQAAVPLPDAFPSASLVLFNRFGQTLRPDEAIELRRGTATRGPRYTAEVRRALVLKQKRTYQQELEDFGWVTEVDATRMSCLIRLRTAGPAIAIPAPLDEVTFAPVKDVLEPNGEGPPVRISGVGVFDTERGLIRLDSIHDVSVLDDPEDLALLDNRLDELSSLEAGWLDGDGIPPDAVVIGRARRILADLMSFEVPRPRVFPTPEGGVQAEWTVENHEISVTFEPDGKLYAVSVNVASGETQEPELTADDAQQIAQLLRVS